MRGRGNFRNPLRATATCPDSSDKYIFLLRHPQHDDTDFELLGPCPECAASVPVATVRHLADLGTHLVQGPETIPENGPLPSSYPHAFPIDEGHTPDCRFSPTSYPCF